MHFSAAHSFTVISPLRGSPSTGSSPRVLRCAISLMCMSRQSAFSKVTGTILSCLQRLGGQAASSSRAARSVYQ